MSSYAVYHGIILPTQAQVQTGIQFGWAGTEFTGSLGSSVYTAAANVRYNTDRGDGVLGTLRVPTASQVLNGVLVDATTGNVVLPAVGDVQSPVTFGASSALIGTFIVPTIDQVKSGIGYGASGTEFTGILSGGGTGTSYSIAVKDSSGSPIPNVACWVATDIAGNSVITSIWYTDSSGIVNFILEPGTYYLFRQKNGKTFTTNPRSFTVA